MGQPGRLSAGPQARPRQVQRGVREHQRDQPGEVRRQDAQTRQEEEDKEGDQDTREPAGRHQRDRPARRGEGSREQDPRPHIRARQQHGLQTALPGKEDVLAELFSSMFNV